MGYFPGEKLGIIGDLPKSVINQWRRWCFDPEYCVGAESADVRQHVTRLELPIRSLIFSDDEMLSLRNMQDLHYLFGSTDKKLLSFTPEQMNVGRIGHLGFFLAKFEESLWPSILLPELI